jgi:hypothetical protein
MTSLPAAASIEQRLDAALIQALPALPAGSSAAPFYRLWTRPHCALYAAFNRRWPRLPDRLRYVLISSTAKDRPFLLRDLNRLCPHRGWAILTYARVTPVDAALAAVHAELADVALGTNRWFATADCGRIQRAINKAAAGSADE